MIRRATIKDYTKIYNIILEKKIPYITVGQIFTDINNKECYIIEENNNIKGVCSLVACPQYHNYAIKRMCIFEEKHGHARKMINFLINQKVNLPIVCTPWDDNIAMRKILETSNFKLKYIFNYHWCLYERVS